MSTKQILLSVTACICALTIGSAAFAQSFENSTWVHHERQAPLETINFIHSLPTGDIAVHTAESFHLFNGTSWSRYPLSDDLSGGTLPFLCDHDGMLYLYESRTIYRWDTDAPAAPMETFDTEVNLAPINGAAGPDNSVFVGSSNSTNGGVYRFDGESLTRVRAGQTQSLTVAGDGSIWAIHRDSTVGPYRLLHGVNDTWTDLTDSLGTITETTHLFSAPDGAVWINDQGDYTIIRNSVWESFGGGVQKPLYLAFDNTGEAWGCTTGNLFRRNASGKWETSFQSENLLANRFFFAAGDGDRLFVSNGIQLYEYDESVVSSQNKYPWREVPNPYDLGSNMVTCMVYTDDSELLCGHGRSIDHLEEDVEQENAGLSIFDGETWRNLTSITTENKTYYFLNVYALSMLDNGDIAISSDYGFDLKYTGTGWELIDSLYVDDSQNPSPYGTRIGNDYLQYSRDEIYVATTNGLVYHDFEYLPDVFYPSFSPGYVWFNFRKLRTNGAGVIYMQNELGDIISFDPYIIDIPWHLVAGGSKKYRDYIIIDQGGESWIWTAFDDGLTRTVDGTYTEQINDAGTGERLILPVASMITQDEDDRVWASGYGKTGYLDDDGVWHQIEALTNTQATVGAFDSYYEHIAFNSTRIDTENQEETVVYMGLYTYDEDAQTAVADEPEPFNLARNYPNPFNAATTITFTLSALGKTSVEVYSLTGQRIRILADRSFVPGTHHIRWDGCDEQGQKVGSGLYFYRIASPHATMAGKMLLLK